jgi:hypothetical protein
VISILKIKCNLSFHWELVDCKLLRGRWLRAQVCGVANIHRVEIWCIGSRGTAGEFMSVSQVIFTPIVVFIKKIGPHPTSIVLPEVTPLEADLTYLKHPIKILDQKDRVTRHKTIKFFKVQWSNHSEEEATWESKDFFRSHHPEFKLP